MKDKPGFFGSVNHTGKATLIVMGALILSKLTGQFREMLIPSRIGYGMLSDAYILGFLVPDLVYQLLVGGSIQAAVTPTLSGAICSNKEKQVWRSLSVFINITALIMIVAVIIGEILIPHILPLISGDKGAQTIALGASVSARLFPQVFFMMLAALSIGILNAYKRFTAASLGPVFYNICVIAAMLVFGNKTANGVINVAAGVLISSIGYFLLQFYFSREHFEFYRFSFNIRDKGFTRLVSLAVPTLISASIVQLNLIILAAFTNFYDDGALTSLRFAITTWQLPYGIFAVAIGGVMLPTLSGHYASGDYKACSRVITQSLRSALYLIIPSAVIFALLSREVIRGIFEWGAGHISEESVSLTGAMLAWYCIAMIAHTVNYLMNMSFYSAGMTKIPLFNGAITLITNTAFCYLLTTYTGFGVVSMPIAYSLSAVISMMILSLFYFRLLPLCAPRKIPQFLIKSMVCAAMTAVTVYALGRILPDSTQKILQLLSLGAKAVAGMGAFILTSWLLQMKEVLMVHKKVIQIGRKWTGKSENTR
jgi:putative peptidoglycan lipid II flippase